MKELVRRLMLGILRIFYPDRRIRGQPPEGGPCIIVANHVNGLIDPALVALSLGRPVAFLAMHSLFEMPVIRWLLAAFHAIPVHRARDGDVSRNVETFASARAVLAEGGFLALFPEGTSHSEPRMLPLRTGAARIALGGPSGIRIVPVGLTYADKAIFRSPVALSWGPALAVDEFRRHGGEDRQDVEALTEAIEAALRAEVLEAENAEIWQGFRNVASWLAAPRESPHTTEARALAFSKAWPRLSPERREAMEADARAFAGRLEGVGIRDPWVLDVGMPGPAAVLRAALPLVAWAPLAVGGVVLGWIPYRGIGRLVRYLNPEGDLIATYKLLGGVLFLPLWWGAESLALALWHPWVGLAALLLGPLTGYVALRWEERWHARHQLGRAWWLLWTARGVADAVLAERTGLAQRVAAELAAVG